MNKVTISVGVFVPRQPHELLKDVVCQYFGVNEFELLKVVRKEEAVYRRSLLFTILVNEMSYKPSRVAELFNTSRQAVDKQIASVNVAKSLYLHFSCDYNAIKDLFSTLQLKQKEWLERNLQ